MENHIVTEDNAEKILGWLRERGGIAIWRSVNLSNPGASWTSPAKAEDGTPTTKPRWQAANEPERIITDPAEVSVATDEEVKRFHIAVRYGSQGMSLKLTDGSSNRVRNAVEKAGEGAWYEFDYDSQEAVIYRQKALVPLLEWVADRAAAKR